MWWEKKLEEVIVRKIAVAEENNRAIWCCKCYSSVGAALKGTVAGEFNELVPSLYGLEQCSDTQVEAIRQSPWKSCKKHTNRTQLAPNIPAHPTHQLSKKK